MTHIYEKKFFDPIPRGTSGGTLGLALGDVRGTQHGEAIRVQGTSLVLLTGSKNNIIRPRYSENSDENRHF
jgi:hypothetical protein